MDEQTIPVRLYSLGKDFRIERTVEVLTMEGARAEVEAHIAGSGYTNLRTKDDGEGSLRFIADPPKGRKGRNVASLDF